MRSDADMNGRAVVHSLLERVTAHPPDPILEKLNGTWEFDIDQCGRWYVNIAGGRITVSQDRQPATCTFAARAGDFVDVLEGRQSLITAYLRGRLKASGDLKLGLSFRRLLPV